MSAAARLRPAVPADAPVAAELLFDVSPADWLRAAGTRGRAVSAISACFRRRGTTESANVVTVAEQDSALAGLIAAFPASEALRRDLVGTAVSLPHLPPRRWPAMFREWRHEYRTSPRPPADALYVDSLITAPRARRQGVARALLTAAEGEARARGLPRLALDTDLENAPARSLYEEFGFVVRARRTAVPGMPGLVVYVKELATPRAP